MRVEKGLAIVLLAFLLFAVVAANACLRNKLCCRTEMGKTECVARCVDEMCPVEFSQEVFVD